MPFAPGGAHAEGELGSEDFEAADRIRQIAAKIKAVEAVEARKALSSDADIERLFTG